MADNLDEFIKKYNHTFVKHHPSNAVVYINGGVAGHVVLENETMGQFSLKYPDSLTDISVTPPVTGFFNHKGYALLLFKSPARQWKRGLCSENHEIYNPFWAISQRLFTPYRPTWGWRLVNSLFNRQLTHSVDESIIRLNTDSESSAISFNLAVSKSPTDRGTALIWYRHAPVGYVEKQRFNIHDEIYRQEVVDELRRIGQHQWIS